jgi:death-on-curing protein
VTPVFLTLGEILAIHESVIQRYGGSLGVRELSLLESAMGMPQATFGGRYLHDDIPSMAAAYCFHLVANHPFVDGSKRVGAAAASVFLDMNGWELAADQLAFAEYVLAIASSRADKQAALFFFKQHSRRKAG